MGKQIKHKRHSVKGKPFKAGHKLVQEKKVGSAPDFKVKCLSCKKEFTMANPKLIKTMPNGVRIYMDACPKCGRKMSKFVGSK